MIETNEKDRVWKIIESSLPIVRGFRRELKKDYYNAFKLLEDTLKAHEKFIGKLLRQINCVKDHPEIKPLNCCWMADSIELKERRKECGIQT